VTQPFSLASLAIPGTAPKVLNFPGLPTGPRPVPQRRLSNWLEAFARFARFGEAPDATLFWTGVSTIAGALRRQVWIDQGYFKWVPNFYIILVAKPGIISKSTTANVGMNLLRKVPGIQWGPEVVTWPALVQSRAASAENFVDPATGEYMMQSALTICSDEFGNLLNPQDREMVDIFVGLWDGKEGSFEKKTKSSGNDTIINPWINIIACTTPAWISGNFPEYMIGGGFTSRCIFVFSDAKRQLVAYPKRLMDREGGVEQLQDDLIHDLEAISLLAGEVKLTEEAYAWGEQWYLDHWANPHRHLDQTQFGGYLARKQTHVHKLAMILSAATSNDLTITREILETAATLVTGLEPDMNRVFAKMGQNDITRLAQNLCEIIAKNGPTEQGALYQAVFRYASYNVFQEALTSCVNAHHLALQQVGMTMLVKPY
jgi:hypothetical protein